MMIMYSGQPFNCICYDCNVSEDGSFEGTCGQKWFSVKNTLKEVHPLINLPYVIDGTMIITQSNACLQYVGRKLSMMGKNEEEQSYCEQLLCEVRAHVPLAIDLFSYTFSFIRFLYLFRSWI